MLAKTLSFAAALALLAASPSGAAPATAPVTAPATAQATVPAAKAAAASSRKAAASPAVFPSKISPKYASQSAGQGRMHTCLDQYNANKATQANGGMAWIQKGGGYYSTCSKKLKG